MGLCEGCPAQALTDTMEARGLVDANMEYVPPQLRGDPNRDPHILGREALKEAAARNEAAASINSDGCKPTKAGCPHVRQFNRLVRAAGY